jgi:septal ring factor EnvC (AmiA/AmiB activator)
MFGADPRNTHCDFSPSRFQEQTDKVDGPVQVPLTMPAENLRPSAKSADDIALLLNDLNKSWPHVQAELESEIERLTEQCRKISDERNTEIVRLKEKLEKQGFEIADLNKEIEKLRAEKKELLDELPM